MLENFVAEWMQKKIIKQGVLTSKPHALWGWKGLFVQEEELCEQTEAHLV